MELRGEHVVLRLATDEDVDALTAVLTDPTVAEWWGTWDRDRVVRDLLGDDETVVWVIEEAGAVVGLLQTAENADPEYRHAGIDLSLVASAQGRGLGTDAVRTAARWLIGERGHHRLTIDPAAHNARAIASYAKVGFRPVGILRAYERGRDGTFHDGLLMDLLAHELT